MAATFVPGPALPRLRERRVSRPTRCSASRPSARRIRLVASDLDGTLLNTRRRVDSRDTAAIERAVGAGVCFVPATGKSRGGATRALGALGGVVGGEGGLCGVFLNGLFVVGVGGRVLYEGGLSASVARVVVDGAVRRGLEVFLYSGDRVFVERRCEGTDMFVVSHEAVPEAVGDLGRVVGEHWVHKVLLVDPGGCVRRHRNGLAGELEGVAEITQARPDVLEVLPCGTSKGAGLVRLLEDAGVGVGEAMAIGDGENDVAMIATAGLGVAVANAVPEVLRVADEVVRGHDDAAVADAIDRFVLFQ